MPFGIICSDTAAGQRNGRPIRGRRYAWGVVEVDNEAHSDLRKLQRLVIRCDCSVSMPMRILTGMCAPLH